MWRALLEDKQSIAIVEKYGDDKATLFVLSLNPRSTHSFFFGKRTGPPSCLEVDHKEKPNSIMSVLSGNQTKQV